MNLSKMKFALVSAMIMGVFSLNLMNPFEMSNNEFDVKGMANEMSMSITSTQAENAAIIPTTVFGVYAAVAYVKAKMSCSGDAMVNTNTNVFDGIAKISTSAIAMNKLD